MSIYTKMIDVINERGLGRGQAINQTHGCVCLLGARAIARGHTVADIIGDTSLAYTSDFNDIPELMVLIWEEHDAVGNAYRDAIYDQTDMITTYNDQIIKGHASKAIDILKKAEKKRRTK